MECIITSRSNTKTLTNLTSIHIPTTRGITVVRTGHAEYFGEVTQGILSCYNTRKKIPHKIPVTNGICHVRNNIITIII